MVYTLPFALLFAFMSVSSSGFFFSFSFLVFGVNHFIFFLRFYITILFSFVCSLVCQFTFFFFCLQSFSFITGRPFVCSLCLSVGFGFSFLCSCFGNGVANRCLLHFFLRCSFLGSETRILILRLWLHFFFSIFTIIQ